MTQPTSPDSKVLFRMPEDDGSAHVETLWATALGNDEYKLDNSPFYAYSVSWEDIVYAPFDKTEGFPTFVHVVKKSGHRTIRVIFDPPVQEGNESDVVLQGLVSLGCTYEGAIVQGITSLKGTSGGKSFEADVRFTDTLIKGNGQWRLVVSHVTRIQAR